MLNIPEEELLALPLDQLAFAVLGDLLTDRSGHTEGNFFGLLKERDRYGVEAMHALAEAFAWLRGAALLARDPGGGADSVIVTRAGRRVAAEGLGPHLAATRIGDDLHADIAGKARPQFLLGEHEMAVFSSMRAVEIRVRKLCGFDNALVGIKLMGKAFGANGPLRDPDAPEGESDAIRHLFAGAYGVLRNASGHREVDYDDVNEAAECVHTASLLMRILDRVQTRLQSEGN